MAHGHRGCTNGFEMLVAYDNVADPSHLSHLCGPPFLQLSKLD